MSRPYRRGRRMRWRFSAIASASLVMISGHVSFSRSRTFSATCSFDARGCTFAVGVIVPGVRELPRQKVATPPRPGSAPAAPDASGECLDTRRARTRACVYSETPAPASRFASLRRPPRVRAFDARKRSQLGLHEDDTRAFLATLRAHVRKICQDIRTRVGIFGAFGRLLT